MIVGGEGGAERERGGKQHRQLGIKTYEDSLREFK